MQSSTPTRILFALMLTACLIVPAWTPSPLRADADPPPHDPGAHAEHHAEGHHGGGMRHDFSDAEAWAARFDAADRDAWQKPAEVVALMAVRPGMTVVDLGAGTGYFLPHLAAAVGASGEVLGLDVEPEMVRYMRERAEREELANVGARQVPYDDPELEPASVDRVLIVDTWHHVGERPAYAGKLRTALRPGGAVYIVDYTRDSPRGPPAEHRLEPQQVVDELEAGGLEAEVLEESLPWQYIVVGRRPPS